MPVSPIAASDVPASTSSAPSPAPAQGFASALAAASRVDPASLPSVSLGAMVQALATGARPGAATGSVGAASAGAATLAAAPMAGAPAAGSASGAGARVLAAGERYLGVPYKWGGTDPKTGLDCSGFTQRVFADLGVKLPRVSVDQAKQGTPVSSLAEARPGDLVFWYADGKRPNHIGIYAGDNKMLVAPRTGDVVRYQELSRTPHEIRRIV